MRGTYVKTFENGKLVPVTFPRPRNVPDQEEIAGLSIHYTTKIEIRGDAATDEQERGRAIAAKEEDSWKSCASIVDFTNSLVRSGRITGREIVGSERTAKIENCASETITLMRDTLRKK